MKLILVLRIIFILISVINKLVESNPENYEFGTFENFNLMKEVFVADLNIQRQIKILREQLENERKLIKLSLDNKNQLENIKDTITLPVDAYEITRESLNLFLLKTKLEKIGKISKNDFNLTQYEKYFNDGNYDGAVKGIILLTDTYQLNITEMQEEGVIRYLGKELKAHHVLNKVDLVYLSLKARLMGWYDLAIQFLRPVQNITQLPEPYHHFNDILPNHRHDIVRQHNNYLITRKERAGEDFKVFPYVIDPETLQKKKKQPKFVKRKNFYDRIIPSGLTTPYDQNLEELKRMRRDNSHTIYKLFESNQYKEDEFRRICRHELKGNFTGPPPKCILLHHEDPYLKLGPFKMEVVTLNPIRTIFVDFFSEAEIKFLLEYSVPRLSTQRFYDNAANGHTRKVKQKDKLEGKSRIIHKTIQVWISEMEIEQAKIIRNPPEGPGESETYTVLPYKDEYSYNITFPILYKLGRKIEIATMLNLTKRWSSTAWQTTNYGLGGLCETHMDPHGYLDGVKVPDDRVALSQTGDMMSTFMGWLEDVKMGGETAFDFPGVEGTYTPTKGSAAFWFNLNSQGNRLLESSHGGCPVIGGSKWILNKWIYFFEQWKNFPCGLNRSDKIKMYEGYYK